MNTSRKMGFLEKLTMLFHDETEGSTSISNLVKVCGNMTFAEFTRAWSVLFKRHPLLRATRRDVGADSFFDFNAQFDNIPIKHLETKDFKVINQEYSEEIVKPFDMTRYMWRATLITESAENFYILFGAPHGTSDVRSISWLLGDLLRIVIELRQGKLPDVQSYPIPEPFDQLIDRQRFIPSDTPPEAEEFGFQAPATPKSSQSHNILQALSHAETQKLLEACREQNVTVTSTLCAAFARAIFDLKTTLREHVNIWVAFDLRPYTKEKTEQRILDFYAHMVPFKVERKEKPDFWGLARQSLQGYKQSIKEYNFPVNPDETLYQSIIDGLQSNIEQEKFFAPYSITNPGVLDAAFTELTPFFTPESFYFTVMNRATFGILICATTLNGHLCINFNYSTPALSQELAESFANHIINELRTAITAGSRTNK